MVHKRKIAVSIIGIILMVGIIFAAYLFYQSSPENVIKSRLNLSLPASAEIINYQYDSNGRYFDAKILIEEQSINDIKKQLDNYFGGVTSEENMKHMPSFKNSASWWDMDNDNIVAAYMNFVDVKMWFNLVPHEVWVFISKDKEDKYYLYISY